MNICMHKLFVQLFIGGLCMFGLGGCFSGIKYAKYLSKDTEINLIMDYIDGWQYSEHRGSKNSYAQVTFFEPVYKNQKRRAGITINVTDLANIAVNPPTLDNVLDDLISKKMHFKNARVVSKKKTKLMQHPAVLLEFTCDTVNSLNMIDDLVAVREKIIIVKIANKFYRISYEAREEEYNKFAKAFEHSMKTLKLKND